MTRASDPEALFFTELFHRYSVVRSKLQEVFMNLSDKKCVPCEGGTKPYGDAEITEMLKKVPGWSFQHNRLYKEFKFRNFTDNMAFLNEVAKLAEAEGHHPDFCVHYNRTEFEIWTHAIDGLSENDFILAAKIDQL